MEQIIYDEKGSKITIKYDEVLNIVTINNESLDSEFHGIYKCCEHVGPQIYCIDNISDDSEFTDDSTRLLISNFFWENKVF